MRLLHLALGFCLFCSGFALSDPPKDDPQQNEYEKTIEAVVRNKQFYKAGRFEFGGLVGVMPYDSLMDHYMVGGRFIWHFSDHYGWEVVDLQVPFPATTSYTTDLVSSKGLTNLQAQKIQWMATTNFVVSPLYGKLRLFGSSIMHYDTYIVAGLGYGQFDVFQYSTTAVGAAVSERVLVAGGGPMFDFGLGFKLFLNSAVGLNVDLRNYVTLPTVYGSAHPKSSFSLLIGLSFFLPTFG